MMVARLKVMAAVLLAGALLSNAGRAQSPEVPDMEPMRRTFVQSEILEFFPAASGDPVRYDLLGWTGGDVNRLWLKADGDHSTREGAGEVELQALYGRLISPYFDAQVGVRADVLYGTEDTDARVHLAVGLQGLAQYWFEIEPTFFISQKGDLSASLTASYEMLLTQRLILEPRIETAVALQEVPEFGVGSGFNELDLGLRLRYEILREFAPYVGYVWVRRLSGAAELARAAGEEVGSASVVAGLRLWY